jgi:hypothetical protein
MSRRAGMPNGAGKELEHEKKPVEQRMDKNFDIWTISNYKKHKTNKHACYHKMSATSP